MREEGWIGQARTSCSTYCTIVPPPLNTGKKVTVSQPSEVHCDGKEFPNQRQYISSFKENSLCSTRSLRNEINFPRFLSPKILINDDSCQRNNYAHLIQRNFVKADLWFMEYSCSLTITYCSLLKLRKLQTKVKCGSFAFHWQFIPPLTNSETLFAR